MNSASDIASAVFGLAGASFIIWCLLRFVNDRRLPKVVFPAVAVGACLWLPFSWLIFMVGLWNPYRLSWLRMWPILPGFVPGALLFHPNDGLEFSTMAVTTALLMLGLTWLACRGRAGMIVAAVISLLISVPTSMIAYAAFLS
jgi:hypothetical protein